LKDLQSSGTTDPMEPGEQKNGAGEAYGVRINSEDCCVFYESGDLKLAATCDVCFRRCSIVEGGVGSCNARSMAKGKIFPKNYGRVTALNLDPIEKKPLSRFMPGSRILSVGSYGCNMKCAFCQNSEISMARESRIITEYVAPEKLASIARDLIPRGNIGVAYTYNEPLVGYEYVVDCAKLIRRLGMKNVLVSNGCCSEEVADKVIPLMDAMNIDLKIFSRSGYKRLGGDLDQVQAFIRKAAASDTHLELTTLIVPYMNDNEMMFRDECDWIRSISPDIPLHITRFFPSYRMTNTAATDRGLIRRFREIAEEYLNYVYIGNM
jgi:pyruvate formate lyase activating enzyme